MVARLNNDFSQKMSVQGETSSRFVRPIEADYISTTSRTAGGGHRVRQKDRRGVYQSIDFTQRSPREQEELDL